MAFENLKDQQFIPEELIEQLKDYDIMKSHLLMDLVGKEANSDKLQSVAHTDMEDMAVTYRFLITRTEEGQGTIQVTKDMLDSYGITVEQLHQDALEYSEKNSPFSIVNMNELMYEMSGGLFGGPDEPLSPMYVATNDIRLRGAGVIAYPDFMEQATEKLGGSFFILPSSVHEVILVSDSIEMRASELKEMVTQINDSEVSPEERLTDNVYHYDAEARVFEKASQYEQRMEKSQERKSILDELGNKKQEMQRKDKEEPVSKHFHSDEKPKSCRYCYYWKNRKVGCSLGEENCVYKKPIPKKVESECTDCPYGRVHPCIGWCTKKLLSEMHRH